MKKSLFFLPLLLILFLSASSQINYSANDFGRVPAFTGYFQYGANMGYYGPTWDDKTLADIGAGNPAKNVKGAGVKSLHLPLPEVFLESWAYDVRVDMFNHYASLGIKENTVFLEDPKSDHRDNTNYGCQQSSRLFKNMYEPIWDGGANGTPVNDNNYLLCIFIRPSPFTNNTSSIGRSSMNLILNMEFWVMEIQVSRETGLKIILLLVRFLIYTRQFSITYVHCELDTRLSNL